MKTIEKKKSKTVYPALSMHPAPKAGSSGSSTPHSASVSSSARSSVPSSTSQSRSSTPITFGQHVMPPPPRPPSAAGRPMVPSVKLYASSRPTSASGNQIVKVTSSSHKTGRPSIVPKQTLPFLPKDFKCRKWQKKPATFRLLSGVSLPIKTWTTGRIFSPLPSLHLSDVASI